MAELASPTPGNITLSDVFNISTSLVTIALMPIRSKANKTDCVFPALYFMMDTFIIWSRLRRTNAFLYYNIPLVDGKLIFVASLLIAIFSAFAKALKIDSILWCSFCPSTLIFKLHLEASLNDLKK